MTDPNSRRAPVLDHTDHSSLASRWRLHRGGALALAVIARLAPWAAAIAVFITLHNSIGHTSTFRTVAQWAIAVVGAGVAYVVLDRAVHPLQILATLWRLPLAFARRAPGRLRASFGRSDDPLVSTLVRFFTHDRRARANAVRVVRLSVAMAAELSITGDDLDRLTWAAAVHDIGKLDVPRRILNKPSKPSKKEFAIIREHASGGENYVAAFEAWLGEWTHGVDHHHERWDGTGYPRGLAGSAISIAGRIIAVADSVEAMTAARAYKRPMPVSSARAEVARCSGSQFDPTIAAAFAAIPTNHIRSMIGIMGWLAEFPLVGAVQNLGPSVNQLGTNVASGARMAAGAAAITVGGTAIAAVMANPASAATVGGGQPPAVQIAPEISVDSTPTHATTPTTAPAVTVHVSHTAEMIQTPRSVEPVVSSTPIIPSAAIESISGPPAPAATPPQAEVQTVDTQIDIGSAVMIERAPAVAPLAETETQIADAITIERAP